MRRWNVAPSNFRAHLEYFTEAGYSTFTVSEFARRLRSTEPTFPDRSVVITFDDGDASIAEHAASILADTASAATVFVSTAYVGGSTAWLGPGNQAPFMDWHDIVALDRSGVEIGSHSHHHLALDELDPETARREIRTSQQLLGDQLGHRVTSFAYPFGYHDTTVKQMVAAADFHCACAVKNTLSGTDDDHFAIARILVENDPDVDTLRAVIASTPSLRLRELPSTRVWRQVRRTRSRLRSPAVDDRVAP
jgi:peptidoglycan/xylan/chitin deacetylase (PgdA/CDA1 family)